MGRMAGLDFDEFEEAMRGVDGRYIPVKRKTHDWHLQHLALGDIEIMLGQNGGGSIYSGACRAENFGLFFPLSETSSVVVNGENVHPTKLSWLISERDFHVYNSDCVPWVGVSVGRDVVKQWFDLTHEDFRPGVRNHRIGQVEEARVARLRELIVRMSAVSGQKAWNETAREMLHRQVSWAIYEAIQSMVFEPSTMQGRPKIPRQEIITRALRLLETTVGDPVYVADMCRVTGVSSRTLHAVFVGHFGISPYRFLMLHRLRKIHDALRSASPSETIGEVCGRFGVWDPGRFSRLYKNIYGVLPSSDFGKGHATSADKIVSH